MPLPGKFKIAVLGCRNSYGKAQGNDLSIIAVRQIALNTADCILCNNCIKVCPDNALSKADALTLKLDAQACTECGRCLPVCPTDALVAQDTRYLLLIGGRLGRKARQATPLKHTFTEEELLPITGKILDVYAKHAGTKERFAEVIERIGLDQIEAEILS